MQVVHNNPNMFNFTSTTPHVNDQLFELNNMDEDDDVDMSFQIERIRSTTIQYNSKTRPSILKVYSENITLKAGQAALLKCEAASQSKRFRKQLENLNANKISLDEYFKIKSVSFLIEITHQAIIFVLIKMLF